MKHYLVESTAPRLEAPSYLPREPQSSDGGGDIIDQLDIPADVTELDPAVLSTLPPSVQFEIMQKLREEQFNQNRIKFQVAAML